VKDPKEITIEEVEKFYSFLQGELPEELYIKRYHKLSERQAFQIIYYLQETMHIIPDNFERCITCGCIFDSDNEGSSYKGMHCEDHRKD
jgi:hypothetical protein